MKIALCQINPTVGDLSGNKALILRDSRRAIADGADVAVFPELCVCGYPPRDLLDRDYFVEDAQRIVRELAAELPRELVVMIGFPDRSRRSIGRPLHNALAVLHRGEIVRVVHKRLLPTYDVFDEDRYFEPGDASAPLRVGEIDVGLTICEDVWNSAHPAIAMRHYVADPVLDLTRGGAQLIINSAASPFTLPKRAGRPRMFAELARQHRVPVVFVNQVGGNDDILFDGASTVFGPDGEVRARLAAFREDYAVVDVEARENVAPSPASDEETALDALVMGVGDYARKCGFKGAVLGLSGGIDSALTAAIATRALGADNVLGVAMPTRYSSTGSLVDARALAEALDIRFREVSIDTIFQEYIDVLTPHLDALGKPGAGDVTFENVQSRIRCATLMALSNRLGLLLLTTGNKSEVAVGYSTLYGDMGGGLAVISDVPKTLVYRIAHEVNRQAGRALIPESTLTKAPSAELRPNQTDQDSLPPYDILDAILQRHVEDGESPEEIVEAGFDTETVHRVVRMVRTSEYKRRQMPPGLILTRKAFGPGRRYPIAQRYTR